MHIEKYSDKYYLDVVEIVDNFHREALSAYDGDLDKEVLKQTVVSIGNSAPENAFLLIVDDKCQGILAGVEIASLLNKKRIYQELLWYMNEPFRSHGVRLLKYVQKTLKQMGFDTIIMALMTNSKAEKIERLYKAMGYRPFEAHYIKAL